MKRCRKCHQELPLGAFSHDASRVDGRFPWCKACLNLAKRRRLKNPRKRQAARRQWRAWAKRNPRTKPQP